MRFLVRRVRNACPGLPRGGWILGRGENHSSARRGAHYHAIYT